MNTPQVSECNPWARTCATLALHQLENLSTGAIRPTTILPMLGPMVASMRVADDCMVDEVAADVLRNLDTRQLGRMLAWLLPACGAGFVGPTTWRAVHALCAQLREREQRAIRGDQAA